MRIDCIINSKNEATVSFYVHTDKMTQSKYQVVQELHKGDSMVWTQYAVDAVCSGCSGIVVYGGGDIVFGAKRPNQWMQCTVDAVHSGWSGIVVYDGGDIVFDTKRSNQWTQWTQYAVDAVE